MLWRGLVDGPSVETAGDVDPHARPAAFEAAGRVREVELLGFAGFLESFFWRSVVSMIFRRSGLDPRDDSLASGLEAGIGDAEGFGSAAEASPLFFRSRCGGGGGGMAFLDEAAEGLTGRGGGFGFDRSI
jgi:hypothetical protein